MRSLSPSIFDSCEEESSHDWLAIMQAACYGDSARTSNGMGWLAVAAAFGAGG